MIKMDDDRYEPEWAHRSNHIPHKPDWVDKIPHQLWGLGEVFFPIPRGRKGWKYPHHMDEYRYAPDSETLNAYLEAGWGYGVACDNDLIVIDIDEKEYIDVIADRLPESVYQWSGSGEGVHIFYLCKGVTQRITLTLLKYDHTADNMTKTKEVHIGEVKADSNGYVVGPGSVHPSGNTYGPLKGDEITEIDEDTLLESIWEFNSDTRPGGGVGNGREDANRRRFSDGDSSIDDMHEFYKLSADDILPWLEPVKRIAHPIHGSNTGTNFMKNDDRSTFTCWRCQCGGGDGCGLSPQHILAMFALEDELGSRACEDVKSRWYRDSTLHYHAWKEAAERGLIELSDIPFTVVKGFLVEVGEISEDEPVPVKHNARQEMRYNVEAHKRLS